MFQSFKRIICSVLVFSLVLGPNMSYAQSAFVSALPQPGMMLAASPAFTPVLVKGLVVHPDKPLNFDFIVDSGNDSADQAIIKEQSERIAKYFLAAITVPEDQLWVNLSPFEKDRIIENDLGQTVLGRDMLAQDYVLKQLTASLIYPEKGLGQEFWSKVYAQAQEKFGTTDIPVDTFNKVWIMPAKAEVFEKDNAVYVTEAKLKVMLDSDHIAVETENFPSLSPLPNAQPTNAKVTQGNNTSVGEDLVSSRNEVTKQILREVILPAIEKEVNEGKNFAAIRQVYHAAILAKWYRELIQNTLLADAYVGKNQVAGVRTDEKTLKEEIYQRYIAAYKKGVFDYIKEEKNQATGALTPKKYFSGGISDFAMKNMSITHTNNITTVSNHLGTLFQIAFRLNNAEDVEMMTDIQHTSSALSANIPDAAMLNAVIEWITSQTVWSVIGTAGLGLFTVNAVYKTLFTLRIKRMLLGSDFYNKSMNEFKAYSYVGRTKIAHIWINSAITPFEDMYSRLQAERAAFLLHRASQFDSQVAKYLQDSLNILPKEYSQRLITRMKLTTLFDRAQTSISVAGILDASSVIDIQESSLALQKNIPTDAAMMAYITQMLEAYPELKVVAVLAGLQMVTLFMVRYTTLGNVMMYLHKNAYISKKGYQLLLNKGVQSLPALEWMRAHLLRKIERHQSVIKASYIIPTTPNQREWLMNKFETERRQLIWVQGAIKVIKENAGDYAQQESEQKSFPGNRLSEHQADFLKAVLDATEQQPKATADLFTSSEQVDFLEGVGQGFNTIAIIKPDAIMVKDGDQLMSGLDLIIPRIKAAGFEVYKISQPVTLTTLQVVEFYKMHLDKEFLQRDLVPYMTEGPVVMLFIKGKSSQAAIRFRELSKELRSALGATDEDKVHTKIHISDPEDTAKGFGPVYEAQELFNVLNSQKASDQAMNGGIDINNIDVNRTGTAKIQFNDQAVRDVLKDGFNGFTPVIINITPIQSPLMLLGISESERVEQKV